MVRSDLSNSAHEISVIECQNTNEDLRKCTLCDRVFQSSRGLKLHSRSCKTKNINNITAQISSKAEDIPSIDNQPPTNDRNQEIKYKWGNYDSYHFEKNLSQVYEEIVHWKKNLFLLPTGRAGKQYIEETTRLMNEWLHSSPMKDIAFKAIMIMPNLLLQKPSQKSKSKDHLKALERRMQLWTSGEFLELLHEGKTIQKNLKSSNRPSVIAEISKKFSREMSKGNVTNALKLLSENMQNGILPLNQNTLNQLKQKHPQGKEAEFNTLLTDKPEEIHPIKFDGIDAELVKKAAVRTRGGAGPSGMDADGWRRILITKQFGNTSTELCATIAEVIKKLCTTDNLAQSLEAFLACRLIPLDKNPGLRPIGIGEILRRIVGKVIVSYIRKDLISSVGTLQVCAGHEAGCESIIHAMHKIYNDEESEAVLLVDASNAFNSVNRNIFLHNIEIICPPIAKYVRNCYNLPSRLFIIGGGEIRSTEGTTQGDPTAMAIYAIAIIPLILMLVDISHHDDPSTKTAAYADDFTAAGKVVQLKKWWDTLCELGPKFGYYPEGSKSWLIIKGNHEHAVEIFHGTKIKITTEGQRHLGAVIGSIEYKQTYIQDKVNQWIKELQTLSKIAWFEPQAAYSCFVTGFKHKPTFCMRTIPNISKHLIELDNIINTEFIPAITGGITCSNKERKLISLPVKLGGLGIPIFSEIADREYEYSQMISDDLARKIANQERQYVENTNARIIKNNIKLSKLHQHQRNLEMLSSDMTEIQKRLNSFNQEKGASSWLTTLPIKEEGYNLTKQLFWDLIRIRYNWALSRMPSNCECGIKFDIQHALSCKKGGFVSLRHNHIRNITASLLTEVCKDVRVEPILQELTGEILQQQTIRSNEARLDIRARGFWEAGQTAFFDVRVFNPNAARYAKLEISKAYESNEREKKKLYNERIMQVEHGSFTPLVMAATGGMGRECQKFYNRLAEMISEKRNMDYSIIATWIRRKISFSLIKSIGLCIRGSRSVYPKDHLENSINADAHISELTSNIS